MIEIVHVAGARPNFMKIAPVMNAFADYPGVVQILVHTGQHYDESLSEVFFHELGLRRPDVNLGVGSASHARQTADIMVGLEGIFVKQSPDFVMVVGDVNSTLAGALVAAKLGIPVAHVEAGLRSFDWTMPEEINRVVTDRLSDLLCVTERAGVENLRREGIPADRIHFVGNVMIDTLLAHRDRIPIEQTLGEFGLSPRNYAVVTLHRPSNVDTPANLKIIADALAQVATELPVLFPVHPRTRQNLQEFGLLEKLDGVQLLQPLGYLAFLALMSKASVVLTDSGGVQEETTVLGVPCLTLRPNTERLVTVEQGTNRLVELRTDAIVGSALQAARFPEGTSLVHSVPELWDGRAAQRIASVVLGSFAGVRKVAFQVDRPSARPDADRGGSSPSGGHVERDPLGQFAKRDWPSVT
jgi:UDP-N-acetylglucosamine 2-epimerase (non-hydrolysing)